MALNTSPIFTAAPVISWANITTADTSLDGTGATLIFTADATSGSFLKSVTIKSTTINTTNLSTVRFFINNGSSSGTAANNSLFSEFIATAVTVSNTVATFNIEVPLNIQLPAGYKLYASVATMAGSTGWQFTAFGATYNV